MARYHYWQYLLNEEGQPIGDADIEVTLGGSTTEAYVFTAESGGVATTTPSITTNTTTGYFEFWIGDNRETNGYVKTQKFRIQWSKTGITTQDIDHINVFPNTPTFAEAYTSSTSWSVAHELNSSALLVTCWVSERVRTDSASIARVDDDNITVTWPSASAGSIAIMAC